MANAINASKAFVLIFGFLGSLGLVGCKSQVRSIFLDSSEDPNCETDPSGADCELNVASERDLASIPDAELYAVFCADCHNPLPLSTKLNRNADQIRIALQAVPLMSENRSLQQLKDPQIEAIAVLLTSQEPASNPDFSASTVSMPLANRHLMSSKMRTLFAGSLDTEEDRAIAQTIQKHITDQTVVFGGPCTLVDSVCPVPANVEEEMDAEPEEEYKGNPSFRALGDPRPNPIRSGLRIRACEEVLLEPRAVSNLLNYSGLDINAPRSRENTAEVFLAMTSHVLDDTIFGTFLGIDQAVGPANDAVAWKFIAFSICVSTAFEML